MTTGHCSDAVKSVKPSDKEVEVIIILKGTTGNIQSLDWFEFRVWKNFLKHFSDSVILHSDNLNLHLRNNIKLQSLTHNQLSSPRYVNLFRYSWFKTGYTVVEPDTFENPVKFAFGNDCKSDCDIHRICNTKCVFHPFNVDFYPFGRF
ncbi:hypothetical protein PV325_001753 [Microctonus aethiopoides]|nr:hypothetical protein PV325_001753 [Microctonus aethiopoides]